MVRSAPGVMWQHVGRVDYRAIRTLGMYASAVHQIRARCAGTPTESFTSHHTVRPELTLVPWASASSP